MELDPVQYMLKIGSKAPDFSLRGVDGKTHSLEAFQGKAVAVIFTCNHCPYAKAYEDRIVALHNMFMRGVAFVAINANDSVKYPQDNFENMKIRAKEKHFTFPYLFDETQAIAKAYCAQVTPEVFLFNSEHKLVYHGNVDNNMEKPAEATPHFGNAMHAVLAGKEAPVKQTGAFGCSIKWK